MDYGDIAGRVREAAAAGTALAVRGGNTRSFLGREATGEPFDVSSCRGIVDYDPSELVITVRCGTPLTEVETALAEHGQMLPFEPPRFGPASTIGGMVASGLSGPRRPWAGSVRDYVLGVACVSGRGEVLRFGGRVMKNVAGYDVSRLMTSALGTPGIVVETSFKVLPVPTAESTRAFEMTEEGAIEFMRNVGVTPLPVSATAYHDGRLLVRLSGSEAGVRAGETRLGGEPVADGAAFWKSLRDQAHPFFDGDAPLWRLSLPPAAPPLNLDGPHCPSGAGRCAGCAGNTTTLSNSTRRWRRIAATRACIATAIAAATSSAAPDPVTRRLYQRLKEQFDSDRIINPGRMYRAL
ncbi:MAG: glycolate oxidase subunit GlcE [Gammaproteobacteria bacterium]|nr:glycolate oxidase subunit GlcE [Gammaproteobacteria bacterium]